MLDADFREDLFYAAGWVRRGKGRGTAFFSLPVIIA
jgi:hypothetical protein